MFTFTEYLAFLIGAGLVGFVWMIHSLLRRLAIERRGTALDGWVEDLRIACKKQGARERDGEWREAARMKRQQDMMKEM